MKNSKIKDIFNNKKYKYGGYSAVIIIVFIAVVILLNVGLSALDSAYSLQLDMTQNELFSLSSQSEVVLDNLEDDVYIYTTYSKGTDNNVVELINMYKGGSDKVNTSNIDPNKSPALIQPFLSENVTSIAEGSIIVSNEDNSRFRILGAQDIYSYKIDETTNSYVKDRFIAEGSITTALDYVSTGYMQNVYFISGHGEPSITADETLVYLASLLEGENYNVEQINIKDDPEKLQPGDIIFVFNPTSDLDDQEREIMKALFDKGGRFMFFFNPVTVMEGFNNTADGAPLTNFMSLLKLYGLTLENGVVLDDTSSKYYAAYNFLAPGYGNHEIVNTLSANNYRIIVPNAGAISVASELPSNNLTITELGTTSETSWLKTDFSGDDIYSKDSDAPLGPYKVAVAAELAVGTKEEDNSRMVLTYSTSMLDNVTVGTVSSTGIFINLEYVLDSLAWLKNSDKDIYIRGKSLYESTLIFSSSLQVYVVLLVVCIVVPVIILIIGVIVWLRRKNL